MRGLAQHGLQCAAIRLHPLIVSLNLGEQIGMHCEHAVLAAIAYNWLQELELVRPIGIIHALQVSYGRCVLYESGGFRVRHSWPISDARIGRFSVTLESRRVMAGTYNVLGNRCSIHLSYGAEHRKIGACLGSTASKERATV